MRRASSRVAAKEPAASAAMTVTSITSISPHCEITLPPRSITTVRSASVFFKKSPRTPSSVATSSMVGPGSRSCGKLPRFWRGWLDWNRDRQWRTLWRFAVLAEFVQQNLRDRIKRREHVLTGARDHFETLQPLFPVVQNVFHVIDRRDIREVALVVLEPARDLFDHQVLKGEVVAEIFEALDVLLHFFPLRIGHENNSVHAAQHQLAGGVVNHLTGHGVELKLGHEPFDHERIQR